MKKLFTLLAFLVWGGSLPGWASHLAGGEISYQQLSPNTFQVNMTLYRDCSSAPLPFTPFITVKAPGCNNGRFITLNQISTKLFKPYGPATLAGCLGSFTNPNYEIITYSGQLTFSAAEASCTDWVLSWLDCCRVSHANVVGQPGLYTEAKLKLSPTLVNSSPAFDTLHAPILFVNHNRDYTISMAATDPNGDSLVYSLVAPLEQENTPVTYAAFPNLTTGLVHNANPQPPYANPFNPQIAQISSGPPISTYLPTYPMYSVLVNWNGPATVPFPNAPGVFIWAGARAFFLDAATGNLKFNPSFYDYNSAPVLGKNKYLFTVQVEEYRKINGVVTKLGTIRRETMIQVFDGSVNLNPVFARISANNQTLSGNNQVYLRPGTPLTLQFSATDVDSTDVVSLATNATTILPGSVFTILTNGRTSTGTITWTPTAAHIRDQNYYFQINIKDNANPLRGVTTETIGVKVRATGSVTSVADEAISQPNFSAYPNPFSEELTFTFNLKSKAEKILIYNLLGQQIDQILLKNKASGEQNVQWANAAKYASGTYVARLVSEDKTVQTLKFTKHN